ncbi:MAG: imelysin family protein [Spirosomaceae bacterium]|nr:imelysin family protein [Spirosomataceae bacterium]
MLKKAKNLFFITGLLTGSLLMFWACNQSDNNDPKATGFDRKEMLRQYADNIVKPRFAALQSGVNALQTATQTFVNQPTENSLDALQKTWVTTYETWQTAKGFNFGPAGEEGLRKGLIEEIGTYPAAPTKIENTVRSGQFNFNNFDRDARGFLAVEYLIFGKTPAELVAQFAEKNRRDFLTAAVGNIKTRVDAVVAAWPAYQTEFLAKDGTDVGSSSSQVYNEFVRNFEAIKNFKVGLPLGRRPGQTKAEPEKVEAFYSGESLRFIKANLKAVEDFYYGRGEGKDGVGFKEYLESVEGGKALIASTEAQLTAIKKALDAVPTTTPLSQTIVRSPAPVDALHTELQKHTRFFKSDMSSILGISITFSSGDGD